MRDYMVFGGRLRSPLVLAGLRSLVPDGVADWRLRVADSPPAPAPLAPAAEWSDGALHLRLTQLRSGWRLAYDDTGTYEVSAEGAGWTWHPGPAAPRELVQADLLGRVLALALSARGALPLHGAAVTAAGRGLVLLGPKHAGKSTLAGALVAGGARLVADDMAVVDDGDVPRLRPGAPLLRLWNEAADHLRAAGLGGLRIHGTKQTLADLPAERVEPRATPLDAIYLLDAPLAADGPPVLRTPLSPRDAVVAMLTHAKLGPLLHGPLAAAHLARAAGVAERVPVYALRVAPGFGRLAEVAAALLSMHTPAARAAA
jgi:hypothetical protein